MMRQVVRLGLRLMIFALAAGLLLGATDAITRGPIADQARIAADQARAQVLPAERFEAVFDRAVQENASVPDTVREIYRGYDAAGGEAGVAVLLSVKGYGGSMSLMIGVDASGAISGMRLLEHTETPGLGAKAADAGFGDRFIGQKGPEIPVVKAGSAGEGVQAISGATITTRAVTDGIEQALRIYHALQEGTL